MKVAKMKIAAKNVEHPSNLKIILVSHATTAAFIRRKQKNVKFVARIARNAIAKVFAKIVINLSSKMAEVDVCSAPKVTI